MLSPCVFKLPKSAVQFLFYNISQADHMHLVRVGDKDAVSYAGTDASVTKVTGYLVINFTTIPYQ